MRFGFYRDSDGVEWERHGVPRMAGSIPNILRGVADFRCRQVAGVWAEEGSGIEVANASTGMIGSATIQVARIREILTTLQAFWGLE